MSVEMIWNDGSYLEAVSKFYESQGYSRGVLPEDKILLALEGGEITGTVRLRFEEGEWILRGMQVREDCQRKGLGTRMLKVLENEFGSDEIFCLPHDYLEGFYKQVKFEKVDKGKLPPFLKERLESYLKMGHKVVGMKRPSIKRPQYQTLKSILNLWGEKAEPLFIRKVENFVYELDDKNFILRVTLDEHRSKELLLEELVFVDLLSQNNISVSAPVKSQNGKFVEEYIEGGRKLFASLFHKAPGRHIKPAEDYRPEVFFNLGVTLAKAHKAISKESRKWKRPLWKEETGFQMALAVLDPADGKPYEVFKEIYEWLEELPKDKNIFGLIHGDAHQGNFLMDGDEITLFDFDDSQISWFMYDLAVPIFSFEFRLVGDFEDISRSEKCKEALIKGYLTENPIESLWIERIPIFIAYRAVLLYYWAKARIKKGDLEPDVILRCKEIMNYCLDKINTPSIK